MESKERGEPKTNSRKSWRGRWRIRKVYRHDRTVNVLSCVFFRRRSLHNADYSSGTLCYCTPVICGASFPYFLPFPFLTFCAILPTLFGGNCSHLKRWLVAQPSLMLRCSGVFLSYKVKARSVCAHSPLRYQLISPLSLADRYVWRNTRGKW